jgi:hypothetical protein
MIEHSINILIVGATLAVFLGVFVSQYGTKLGKKNLYLTGLGMLSLFVVVFVGTFGVLENLPQITTKTRLVGWFWPKGDVGSIQIGLFQDFHGLSISVIAWFVATIFLLSGSGGLYKVKHVEQIYGSVLISTAGVFLCWTSLTPWLCFLGIGLTIWAGYISMSERLGSERESDFAFRFLFERFAGLALSMLGAVILINSRSVFSWENNEFWASAVMGDWTDLVGGWIMLMGLWMQFQPFPLLGWSIAPVESPIQSSLLFGQLFPALAAFSVFCRMEVQLRNMDILPAFGWFVLSSVILTVLAAIFQKRYSTILRLWVSAGMSLGLSVLVFSGGLEGKLVFMGVFLGSGVFALLPRPEEVSFPKTKMQHAWVTRLLLALAACSCTGMVGFVSSGGYLRWFMTNIDFAYLTPFICTAFFMYVMLTWRAFRKAIENGIALTADWTSILMPILLIAGSFGILWTGTLSGSVVFGESDRIFKSVHQIFYPAVIDHPQGNEIEVFNSASWIYWVLEFAGILISFLLAKDFLTSQFPAVSHFLAEGYKVDRIFEWIKRGILVFGTKIQKQIDQVVWGTLLPKFFYSVFRNGSVYAYRADATLTGRINAWSVRLIEVPAKLVQLIQNGNIQWYLSFSLIVILVMLIHFLINIRG